MMKREGWVNTSANLTSVPDQRPIGARARRPCFYGVLVVLWGSLLVYALAGGAPLGLEAGADTLVWPISGSAAADIISSPFGPRWQASRDRYDYHAGIDIPAPQDTPVHVVADGVVYKVGWLSADAGLAIVVYHAALGYYTAYLHLNSALVAKDQALTQGQVIGLVGDSGTTDFMHVHFEIRLTSSDYPACTRNPMGYLPRPEVDVPAIQITELQARPPYSMTVSVLITASRQELDVNQIYMTVRDRMTGAIVDEQMVDLNERWHTGSDLLDQDGIRLIPFPFRSSTANYRLAAEFYQLHGLGAFTVTAQVVDLSGRAGTSITTTNDVTPPGQVTALAARLQQGGGVDLVWVAPGESDDVGTAAAYDIRYAPTPIDSSVWDNGATPLSNPPRPLETGATQTWSLPGPFPDPVYFALCTTDSWGNRSQISNSALAGWPVYLPSLCGEPRSSENPPGPR